MFLFVCLALLVIIGFTYDSRVRDSYWQQQRSHLTRVSSGMESQLQLMSDTPCNCARTQRSCACPTCTTRRMQTTFSPPTA